MGELRGSGQLQRVRAQLGERYRAGISKISPVVFPALQRLGVHVVANNYNSPIPDTRGLSNELFQRRSELVGIDLRVAAQLSLLEDLAAYRPELETIPRRATGRSTEFHWDNPAWSGVDARVLWCLLRHHRPRRVIEVGAGFSTLLAAQAMGRNREDGSPGELVAIEPYPLPFLAELAGVTLVNEPVEQLPLSTFTDLGSDDVLFIDSSHILKTGSDVQYLYLEVLPRLEPGVLVHIHDVFFPWEYPRAWVAEASRFWNEQYLLQAFLAFNPRFEVLWASCLMYGDHRDRLCAALGLGPDDTACGSLWMRVVPG